MTTHYQRKRANAHSVLPIDPGALDVGHEEAEAIADSLLGPPVDSHVSRAYSDVIDALEEVRMACLRIEIIAARMRRTA